MRIRLSLGNSRQRNRRLVYRTHSGFPWDLLSHPRRLVSAAVVVLSMLILLSAIFGQHGFMALRKQQEELKQAEQERERAKAEQLRLKKELDELRTPQGIERVAREEIKLAKPGEIVVTLPDSKGTTTPADQNSKPKNPSNNPQVKNPKEDPKDH